MRLESARTGRRPVGEHTPTQGWRPEAARQEILSALSFRPRWIPSKYFYDERGSRLFERITTLKEYYPTEAEKSILRRHGPALIGRGRRAVLVELGSGDCSKISILLEAARSRRVTVTYVPVDVSASAVAQSCRLLEDRFQHVATQPFVGDFRAFVEDLESRMADPPDAARTICFFGSTIGNLTRSEADEFVRKLGGAMRPGDRFLLGLDLVKDPEVIHRAYNDAAGLTAEFNRNILRVANRLAETDFDPARFAHRAFYDEAHARVEMQLVATRAHEVTSPYLRTPIRLQAGEPIRTEYSHKFKPADVRRFTEAGGLSLEAIYRDARGWFALAVYVKSSDASAPSPRTE